MVEPSVPADIITLADERAQARAERDWDTADELKRRIEATGWRIVDTGTDYALEPARATDIERDGEIIYGDVESVPSRLDEPDSQAATVVVIAPPDGVPSIATLGALASHSPEGTQVLVVADQGTIIEGPADQIIRSVEPFSPGEALQAALRQASGATIIVLEPDCVPTGDIVGPLRAALEDATVAVAGIDGLRSTDLRRYQPSGSGDATALRSSCYAFRRSDAIARGPIDGRLHLGGSVAAWWSLVLRDEGPESQPRRALAMELPIGRDTTIIELPDHHARRARRDAYRIADRFRGHDWLAAEPEEVSGGPADGAGRDDQHDHSDKAGDTAHA